MLSALVVILSCYHACLGMSGPACERVARCREKIQRRRLATAYGLFKLCIFCAQ